MDSALSRLASTPLPAPAGEPEMPDVDTRMQIPYESIRYVAGYTEQYVKQYARAWGDARAEHARRVALESVKFHRQASHISPDFRDCFNTTIDQAIRAAAPPQGEQT